MFGSARFLMRLSVVTAVAAVIRIVEAVVVRGDQPTTRLSDEFGYVRSAELLADGYGFINPYFWTLDRSEVQSAVHPPLFSIVLAVPSALGLDSTLGFRIFNGFIGVAVVFAVGLLARELAGERVGILAAVLAALYPHLWINDTAIMPEALFCLFIVLGLLAAYRFRKHATWPLAAATAAAFSCAAMTRSEGVLFVAFVALPLALFAPGADGTRRLKLAGIVCIVAGVIIGPWVVRNLITFDDPTTMASGTGHVIAYANCDASYSGDFLGYWHDSCALKN
jgi:4-amino-4-deoxy-L-arabinose transferase-like glycosyltransferase